MLPLPLVSCFAYDSLILLQISDTFSGVQPSEVNICIPKGYKESSDPILPNLPISFNRLSFGQCPIGQMAVCTTISTNPASVRKPFTWGATLRIMPRFTNTLSMWCRYVETGCSSITPCNSVPSQRYA